MDMRHWQSQHQHGFGPLAVATVMEVNPGLLQQQHGSYPLPVASASWERVPGSCNSSMVVNANPALLVYGSDVDQPIHASRLG